MNMALPPTETEAPRLRRLMNDLLSVLALPAMWTGNEAAEIVQTLTEALHGMLALDLVCVSLEPLSDGATVDASLVSPTLSITGTASEVATQLRGLLGETPDQWARAARDSARFKHLTFSVVRLGLRGNLGVIVAAASRPDFPNAQDRLLLSVSANQAAVALHEARLRDEQKRIATRLDQSIAQRTDELIAANTALEREVAERKRAEALLAGEKQLLEMIASGQSLHDVLGALCHVVEGAAPDCYCDIHPIDWRGPTIAVAIAPSLPRSYTDPIAGTPLRPEVVPCGIAANENVQVISEDFDTDPRWCTAPVRNHVLDHGLRSVWSTPICSKRGDVLGTLCIYQRLPAIPLPHHQDIIGRATHIASIAIERLQAEDQLRRSQASLEDAQHISLTGSFSWMVDKDSHAFSEQLCRIFEFDDGIEVTSARIAERIHPDDAPVLLEKSEEVRKGRDNPEYELRLLMPDGRIKHVRVLARTIRHADGRLECIGAVQDVTARRHAEDTLNKVRSDLAHVTRVMSLGTLAASIAHEVNQPLSGIITNASTCLRMLSADPPNVDGALETARRTIRDGNRASEVITRLRALFRKTEFAAEAVALHHAAREVIALSQQELRRHRIAVQTEFVDADPRVTGDRVQLQQVILNLLLNAADSLKGVEGRSRRIVVSTAIVDSQVELSVRDNGVGLESDQAGKVFDAFFTTKDDGMGIGLSVSQSIIERHGGHLRAEPNDDGGAVFSFLLPLCEART